MVKRNRRLARLRNKSYDALVYEYFNMFCINCHGFDIITFLYDIYCCRCDIIFEKRLLRHVKYGVDTK